MKVVFLDRDGVINKYPGDTRYVTNSKEFQFLPGSIEGVKKLKEKGFKIFVVSNQAGVAKGVYAQKDLDKITQKMEKGFRRAGTKVDGVYYCTHSTQDNCSCRKPKAGLLYKVFAELKIKPEVSFFIGDSFRDMQAAKEVGAKTVLVLSGKEKISNRDKWAFAPDYILDNLLLAAHYICSHY